MRTAPRLKRFWEYLLSFGAYPEESVEQRGKRRILIGAFWIANTLSIPELVTQLGTFWIAVLTGATIVSGYAAIFAIRRWPRRFALIFQLELASLFAVQLIITAMHGGLLAGGLDVVFGLIMVLAVLVGFGVRAATWWLVAVIASVIYAAAIPTWVKPVYAVEAPGATAAFNLSVTCALTFAVMVYFLRQLDASQKLSDDLLHNILPEEIAARLKASNAMIADHYDAASVLFADVVGFTPMSAGMTPPELVGLLNEVFTVFDRFVDELGLEKIKTVGDEYMVASGVPGVRPDHADAIAELALQIRDHVGTNRFDGHNISLRIGINSGPVVAGVIGTHKFAYDLWGDVVNTASRMESEGVPGSIQVSTATYELIRDRFVCESRGLVSVKGKGDMQTYLLVSKRTDTPARTLDELGPA